MIPKSLSISPMNTVNEREKIDTNRRSFNNMQLFMVRGCAHEHRERYGATVHTVHAVPIPMLFTLFTLFTPFMAFMRNCGVEQ
jgi:hypothetical protein